MTLPVQIQLQAGAMFSHSVSETITGAGDYTAAFPFSSITIDVNTNSVLVFYVTRAGFSATPAFTSVAYGGVACYSHWTENSGDTYSDHRGTLTVLCPVTPATVFATNNLTFNVTSAFSSFTLASSCAIAVQWVDQSRLPPTFVDKNTAVLVPWSLALPSMSPLANEMTLTYCLPDEADVTALSCTPAGTYTDGAIVNAFVFDVSARQIAINEADVFTWTRGAYNPARNSAWASAFSLPTLVPVDTISCNVVLLLHMDGTNGATTTTDSSLYAHSLTNFYGGSLIDTAVKKFGAGSLPAPLGVQKTVITPADVPEFNLASGRGFTIEGWAYFDASGAGSNQTIVSIEGTFGINRPVARLGVAAAGGSNFTISGVGYHDAGSTAVFNLNGATNLPSGQWHHLALVRSGTTYSLYANGILEASVTDATTLSVSTSGNQVDVGGARSVNYLVGWLDEVRIVVGATVYATAFTPPAAAFSDPVCATGDVSLSSVSLLLHMDGADSGTTFTDSSAIANVMVASGLAKTATAAAKFAPTGGQFSSAVQVGAAYVRTPVTVGGPLDLNTGDFTVEVWANVPQGSTNGLATIFDLTNQFSSGFRMYTISDGRVVVQGFGGFTSVVVAPTPLSSVSYNTWHHIAFVRNGVKFYLFFDGIKTDSGFTYAGSGGTAGDFLWVGASANSNIQSTWFNGYLDEMRITKGIARYTADFLPCTCPFPDTIPGIAGGTIYGKFVDALAFAPIQSTNLGVAKPRVWQPLDFYTTKVPK